MSDRGFTILELLVACALLLAVTGVVAAIAVPLRDGFERSLGAADLIGGSRVVLDRLAAEVREAGSGASVGQGRLSDVVAPIVPSASLDSSAWADPAQALRVTRIPLLAPQGLLAADAGAGTIVVTLDTTARCTAVGPGCGLRTGMTAILSDGLHSESAVINAVAAGGMVSLAAPLTSPFAAGSVLASTSVTAFGLRPDPDGAFRLVRVASGTELPLLDGVVDFAVSVRGPDALHPRQVDVTLRVQASSPALRGPAGRLFRRAGTAQRAALWVPDVEIRTTVALRNGVG